MCVKHERPVWPDRGSDSRDTASLRDWPGLGYKTKEGGQKENELPEEYDQDAGHLVESHNLPLCGATC